MRSWRTVIGIPYVDEVSLSPPPTCPLFVPGQGCVSFHVPVQFVQIYVGKEGADYATLWCALLRILEQFPFHHSRLQESPDKIQESSISETPLKELH